MYRIGCGAGFSSDRLEPAVDLVRDGNLDCIIFETIGERTLAFGHRDRRADRKRGYNPQLGHRIRAVLPHAKANGTRIVTNMGVANVPAAAELICDIARDLGLRGLQVAAVLGDEVTDLIGPDTVLIDHGNRRLGDVGREVICANAYLGADAILPAIQTGADVVITGRVSDPSLVVAPLAAHYGWALDDWPRIGQAAMIGHLLECGMQITGGYFADPGRKDVPDLANCGYPIGEVRGDGSVVITKLAAAGGVVSEQTVKEQLLYEVHDPAAYLTPDVTANFSTVRLEAEAANRVRVTGAGGAQRPDQLKVTIGFDGGLLAEAEVSYAGANAEARAALAADVVASRLKRLTGGTAEMRVDLIGVSALHATARAAARPITDAVADVRVRVALRTDDRETAELALWETEALLCCGPAGGGGYRGRITPSVITHSALIPRDAVSPALEVYTA
ncbi:MAG: acyclic terpene utilization AtuA family protein [Pseudomonadota bacterium]